MFFQKNFYRQSYSQQGEDLLIDFIFSRFGLECKFYIDIGANHPQRFSNTFYFSKKGGSGVCVDPNKAFEPLYRRSRPKDTFIASGVTGGTTSKMPYYMMDWHEFNTFDRSVASSTAAKYGEKNRIVQVLDVPVININEFLDRYASCEIDLLNLDVEGMDVEILSAWNFAKFRPKVLCVEASGSVENALQSKLYHCLSREGYFIHGFNHVNLILSVYPN